MPHRSFCRGIYHNHNQKPEEEMTKKQIREYLGHNGHECRVVIHRNGMISRYGSSDPTDRSEDFWQYVGEVSYYNNI